MPEGVTGAPEGVTKSLTSANPCDVHLALSLKLEVNPVKECCSQTMPNNPKQKI